MARVHGAVVVGRAIKLIAVGMFASTLHQFIKIQFVDGELDVSDSFLVVRIDIKPATNKISIKPCHMEPCFYWWERLYLWK